MKDQTKRLVAGIVAAILAIGGITVAIDSSDDGHGHKTRTVSIQTHVDGVDRDTKADDVVILNQEAQGQLDKIEHTANTAPIPLPGATGEPVTPPGFAAELAFPLSEGDVPAKPVLAGAAQSWPGCRTAFVRNQSYRSAGIKLEGIVEHYTVSADTPGWADNDALTARANDPVAGVSWHFQIGREDGNCTYNVPIQMKAWHAAGANSATVGIEIHATGNEGTYVVGAGRARLAKVVRRIEQQAGIPNQKGEGHCAGSTFVITKPGLFRHVDLGACGGGHVDTNPFADPRGQTISDVAALSHAPISAEDRRICESLHAFNLRAKRRRHHHGKPKATVAGTTRAARQRTIERNRGHRCVDGTAVQRN